MDLSIQAMASISMFIPLRSAFSIVLVALLYAVRVVVVTGIILEKNFSDELARPQFRCHMSYFCHARELAAWIY